MRMSKRTVFSLIMTMALAAALVAAVAPSSRERAYEPPANGSPDAPVAEVPASDRPAVDGVVLRMFLGRAFPTSQEVSITTVFRDPSFTVVADVDDGTDSEEVLLENVRELFSLDAIVSLGASRVSLQGGAVSFEDADRRTELRISGTPIGRDYVRLMVSQAAEGEEVVATSVVARRGKTIVLAGSPASGGQDLLFVCLTPVTVP